MSAKGKLDLKVHLINALFQDVTGRDAYLAGQIGAAIESSIDPALPHPLRFEQFFRHAEVLLERLCRKDPAQGFSFWSPSTRIGFQPLLARQELIALFRRLSPCSRATVVIGNLRHGICPDGRRWNARRRQEYAEAIALIQELARAACPRNSNLTVVFL